MAGLPGFSPVVAAPVAPPAVSPTPASTAMGAGVAPESDPRSVLLSAITHALAHPVPAASPAPVLSPVTNDPLTQAINAKMAGQLQGPVTMANAYAAPVAPAQPTVQPVQPPQSAPQTSYFTDVMAPLGGTFETLGHTAALAADELFGSRQAVAAQKAALRQIDQNQNTIAQGNAQIGGFTGTAVRGAGDILQQVPALASMALAPEAAPEAEGSTFLGRALAASLRNGAAAAPITMLQGAGTAIGSGHSAARGILGGAVNALALGATGGSLAPELEAIKGGHILSAMGHNAVLGAGAGGAMQIGQNIETDAPLTRGVAGSVDAGLVGGAALGGAGAAIAKAGRSLLSRVGVLRNEIGAPPLEEEASVAPDSEATSSVPSTPTVPLMLTHDGTVKVPPPEEALADTERQPLSGAVYANDIQDRAQQALQRDADVQNAVSQMAKQSKALALPAPAPFREAVGQYQEIGNILRNPTLDSEGIADAISRAGVKPTSLPSKIRNAPNIIDALESHAETASISPERATRLEQAAANVRQHLGLLASHQNTLADYLTSHPVLQAAADNNALQQAHGAVQSLLSAPDKVPSPELDGLLQQYQHNQDVLNAPSGMHPEVQNVLATAGIKNPIPTSIKNASDLSQALTAHAAKISAQYPARSGQFTQAASSLGDMLAQKQSEQDALATQIASHLDAVAKPAQESTLTASQDAPTPETPVLTPTEKAAQTGVGAETQGQPLANEIMAENSPEKRVADAATQAVKKAEKQGVVQEPAPVQPTQLSPQERLAAAHAAVAPYLPNPKEKYFPDNSKLPPDIQKAIKDYGHLKPIVDADKRFAADPASGFDREDRAKLTKNNNRLDNLAHLIAAHPAISGEGDLSDVVDRTAIHASNKTHGRIHDIRDMTGWNPLDDSQVKRAAIVVRRMFGDKTKLHVADLASKGRRGETDLKDIYLASHALGNGLQTTYHEAWHIAREQLLTKSERSMMDKSIAPGTRRFKMLQEWGEKHAGPATREQIESDPVERPALYAEALMTKQLPRPTGMVGRLFGKVQDTLDRLKSGLNGAGFNSADDLVRKGFAGEFRNREPVMSIPDANDRIDAERRGGVPRDVYERALEAQKNGPVVYNPAQAHNFYGAANLDSVMDREATHRIDESTRPARQRGVRAAQLSSVLEQLKDFAGSGAVPSYIAHRYSDFRRLYRATEARYMHSRSLLAQSAHLAPAFFPRYVSPFLKDADGNMAKWPEQDMKAAEKMLLRGNRLREVYTPEQLKAAGLSPKAAEIYRQGRALGDFNTDNMFDAREYKRASMRAMANKMIQEHEAAAANLQAQLAKLAPGDATRGTVEKELEGHNGIVGDNQEILKNIEAAHGADVEKTARLKAEGYLPSLRRGKYIGRVSLEMPEAKVALPRIVSAIASRQAKMNAHLNALGLDMQTAQKLKEMPLDERNKSLVARGLSPKEAHPQLRAVQQQIAGLRTLADLKEEAERNLASGSPRMTTTTPLAAFSHDSKASVAAETKAFLAHPDTKAMLAEVGAKAHLEPIEAQDSPEAYQVSNADLMAMLDRVDAKNMGAADAFSGHAMDPRTRVQLMRDALARDSALFNRMVARKDVIGEDQNARAALVHGATSAAEMNAAALHSIEQREAYGALEGSDRRNYATQYLDSMLTEGKHADPVSAFLRKYAGLMMLGGKITPAIYTAFTNLPLMAAHLGYNERDIGAVAKRMTNAFRDTYKLSPEKLVAAAQAEKGLGKLTKDEVQHLYKAHLDGSIEAQYAHLVRGGENGPMQSRTMQALTGTLMSPLGATESHLRMASELAFLRQFKDLTGAGKSVKGLDMDAAGHALPETDASKFARDMTNQSNQNYNREDAIPALTKVNGDLSTLLQFATPTYRIIGGAMAHLAHTDPKMLGALVTGLGMAGGYQALPAIQDLMDAYNSVSGAAAQRNVHMGALGDGLSAQQLINQTIRAHLPKELASVLIHGALSKMPGGMDLAPYVSMGDIGSGLVGGALGQLGRLAGATPTPGPSAVPPAFAALSNTIKTAGDLAEGNTQAALHHDPVSLINSLMSGAQELKSGVATSATGDKVGSVTPLQAMLKMFGIMPTKLENRFQTEQEDRYALGVQKAVLGQYRALTRASLMTNSPELQAEAQAILNGYNKANPAMPITPNLGEVLHSSIYGHMNPLESMTMMQLKNKQLHGLPQ